MNKETFINALKESKSLTVNELSEIGDTILTLIKHRNLTNDLMSARNYQTGMVVEFEPFEGHTYQGTVLKVNKRSLKVETEPDPVTEQSRWNVGYRNITKIISSPEENKPESSSKTTVPFNTGRVFYINKSVLALA